MGITPNGNFLTSHNCSALLTLRMAECVWLMDRTVTSDANLQWLRTTGRRYLVGTPRASGARGREIAATNHWQQRPQWRSQTVPGPVGHETFRLTHDAFAEGIER